MTEQSLKNFKKGQKETQPRLLDSLTQFLKYISYNMGIQKEMGKPANFKIVTDMKLHEVCLDFENKFFPGKEGLKLHNLAYKVLCPCLRENLDTDID